MATALQMTDIIERLPKPFMLKLLKIKGVT
jgi:hypothetical protein